MSKGETLQNLVENLVYLRGKTFFNHKGTEALQRIIERFT